MKNNSILYGLAFFIFVAAVVSICVYLGALLLILIIGLLGHNNPEHEGKILISGVIVIFFSSIKLGVILFGLLTTYIIERKKEKSIKQ
jgi:hypothetical protein